jgi:CTP synthase (UTP-ammonia lyase)
MARNVLGIEDADHAETSPDAEHLAVTPLVCSLAGQSHEIEILPGTSLAAMYGTARAVEPFFCSYGINPELVPRLEEAGLRPSAHDADGALRAVELDDHPFFVGTLFVFQARDERTRPHPVTAAFLAAAA